MVYLCGSTSTISGKPCRQKTLTEGIFCSRHKDKCKKKMSPELKDTKGKFYCVKLNMHGNPCGSKVKLKGDVCSSHKTSDDIIRCGYINSTNGKTCRNKVKTKGIPCHKHINKVDRENLYTYCAGKTTRNKPCSFTVRKGHKFCKLHTEKEEVKSDNLVIEDITEEREFWRSLESINYDAYHVSSLGKIWSDRQDKLLEGTKNSNEYMTVGLTDNDGNERHIGIHTIMGKIFLGITKEDAKNGWSVDHINRDRSDNRLINLRRATQSQQNKNQDRSETKIGRGVQKLSIDGKLIRTFATIREAALYLNIPKTTMKSILSRKEYKGFVYRDSSGDDFPGEVWLSSLEAYPELNVFWVSSEGRYKLANGVIRTGSKSGNYLIGMFPYKNSNKRKKFILHVPIARIWNGPCPQDKDEIHHIDGDGTNNRPENLVYVTKSEHARLDHGVPVRQLSIKGNFIAKFDSIVEAREVTGAKCISQVINGRCKISGGYRWESS